MTHAEDTPERLHSADDETTPDVAEGVTNQPRGTGDLDEDAQRAGEDKLEQAGGGH